MDDGAHLIVTDGDSQASLFLDIMNVMVVVVCTSIVLLALLFIGLLVVR